MIINKLEHIYLNMEYAYRKNTEDNFIISGYCNKKYWCRFNYFKKSRVLVVVNTITSEVLTYKY